MTNPDETPSTTPESLSGDTEATPRLIGRQVIGDAEPRHDAYLLTVTMSALRETAYTDPERVNEDASFASWYAAGVFDGVGGLEGSAHISRRVADICRELQQDFDVTTPTDPAEVQKQLAAVLRQANEVLELEGKPGGTTAVITQFFTDLEGNTQVAYAHAGDSRLYMLVDGQVEVLTIDHGPNDAAMQRRLDQASALSVDIEELLAAKQNARAVSSRLGVEGVLEISVGSRPVTPGTRLLLATDGLYENTLPFVLKERLESDKPGTHSMLMTHALKIAQHGGPFTKIDDMCSVMIDCSAR